MPATTDHNRRDAMAAAYAEIQLTLGKYRRRFFEAAKADIDSQLAELADTGRDIDGTAVGRAAAESAIGRYLGGEVHEPVAGTATPAAIKRGKNA